MPADRIQQGHYTERQCLGRSIGQEDGPPREFQTRRARGAFLAGRRFSKGSTACGGDLVRRTKDTDATRELERRSHPYRALPAILGRLPQHRDEIKPLPLRRQENRAWEPATEKIGALLGERLEVREDKVA